MLDLFKSKTKTARSKILFVDDEADLISTVECRLKWADFDVVTAPNGKEGLDKAETEKPNLILLDANMPVMNGYEMLEQLKKNPQLKDIPVIMLTAMCEALDIAKASSYGIADYITKPFDFTELVEKISNVLKNKTKGNV
jgi:two-component system alkaline phosphatase synthesis response regulator PhoP/two-component system response regulator VicR